MNLCNFCNKAKEVEHAHVYYGKLMSKHDVNVHYYCLLVSTKLIQRGSDNSGILGFLLRDIRAEVAAAKQRKCVFCNEFGASINCHKCGCVFHLPCGMDSNCVTHYTNDFRSYCTLCAPRDDYQRSLEANPPQKERCGFCLEPIMHFKLNAVCYGDCCRNGFAHRLCMRRYALSAGYYVRCPWCRESKFRDLIRLQSVFVPDRDATWELQPNAFKELHSRSLACQQNKCYCHKGREYSKNIWTIQVCILCAAMATHGRCRAAGGPAPNSDFKCTSCIEVEKKVEKKKPRATRKQLNLNNADGQIDESFFTKKFSDMSVVHDDSTTELTDGDSSTSNENSVITVINQVFTSSRYSQMTNKSVDEESEKPELIGCLVKPPLWLKQSFTADDHFFLVVYEWDGRDNGWDENDPLRCVGTCTLRFELNDKRIEDRSEEALLQLQVTMQDVYFRDTDRGIFDELDKITEC